MRKLAITLLLTALAAPAFAGSATLHFTKPTNKSSTTVKVLEKNSAGDVVGSVPVTIPPGISAKEKRDLIRDALNGANYDATDSDASNGDPGVKITGITALHKIAFLPGATGEEADSVIVPRASKASVSLPGVYSSSDWDGKAAVFTFGVSTERGSATVQYRADDVNPNTGLDGAVIADRLYSLVRGVAADLGASVYLSGYQLLVEFEAGPGSPKNGMVFGTTSPGRGLAAEAVIPPNVRPAEPVPH